MYRILSVFMMMCCFSLTAQQKPIPIPDTIKAYENVDYAVFGERKVQLGVYRPNTTECLPGIVVVHGGGWKKGSRHSFQPLSVQLAEKGYVVVNIDYRLSGEAKFPAGVEETKAAVRWLRANAKKYHVKSDKIGAVGGSAGGHLVAMASLTGHTKQFNGEGNHPKVSSEIQATIIMGPGVDQVTRVKKAPNQHVENCFIYFGGEYADIPETYALASPISHVTKNMGPIFMLDGSKDRPGERYVDFVKVLDKYGVPNKFEVIKGAKHGQWVKEPYRSKYIDAFDKFLRKYLK